MASRTFDVIVIGAGPGGYVAAIRAAQNGKKVVIVEREHLGGICLNWGCIPTKALLRSAEVFHLFHRAKEFGLSVEKPSFDFEAVIKRSRGVAKQLSGGIGHLMKKNKIEVVMGAARLAGKGRVTVTTAKGAEELEAPAIVLATGARARSLPGMEPDGELIWNYKHALQPPRMPKELLVIGSGAIGIEFASFFNTMGAKVTVVEVAPRILPVEDEEVFEGEVIGDETIEGNSRLPAVPFERYERLLQQGQDYKTRLEERTRQIDEVRQERDAARTEIDRLWSEIERLNLLEFQRELQEKTISTLEEEKARLESERERLVQEKVELVEEKSTIHEERVRLEAELNALKNRGFWSRLFGG